MRRLYIIREVAEGLWGVYRNITEPTPHPATSKHKAERIRDRLNQQEGCEVEEPAEAEEGDVRGAVGRVREGGTDERGRGTSGE